MDQDKVSNNVQSKKRKIDWNGVIIKELRKVFKASHLKPMKIISPHGKEENAPWRVWFEVAYSRGIHTQLPEDILKKALDRYPVQATNGQQQRQDAGEPVMFDNNPPPNGFTGFLIEPLPQLSQPLLPQLGMPQQPKALNYLFTSSGPIPPPDRRFDLLPPHPAPPPIPMAMYDSPIDRMSCSMVFSGEPPTLHSSTPAVSTDPSLFIASPETFSAPTPPQPALQGGYPAQVAPLERPESPTTPQLDAAIDYLTSRKDIDIKLPPLDAIPPEQKTSNPALPTFPVAPISPHARSRYSTSWPSDASSAFGSSDVEYSSDHGSSQGPPITVTHVLPPRIGSVPKAEPMEDDAAIPKTKLDFYSNASFTGHSNGHSTEHHSKFPPIKVEKIEADAIHAREVTAHKLVTYEFTNYSDVRLKEDFEVFSDGMQVVRDLEPVKFRWKDNAQDIINSQTRLPPDSYHFHKDLSTSVKSITIANTKANTNIPSGEHEPQVPPSKENAPHVNFDLDTKDHISRASTPSSSHASPSSFVRASSVPASLHAPPVAPPIAQRTYSERYLYAHLPDRRYYNAYVYEDEKYNSDYEVSDDSSDEDSDREDDGDMGDDELETQEQKPKTIGFAAQNVQRAHPNLVKEDPNTGILSIDPVGLLASVVGAVKDLDLRTTKLESSHTLVTPASFLSPVNSPIHISPPPSPIPAPLPGVISLCSLEKGYLVINPKALDFLRVQSNVSILTVCGPKKTGKSLFCNMFLPRDCTEKFNMSSAVDGPKGLWMYNAPISDKRGEKNYLVVDSTGIDYNDANVDKLVTLIWLISSVLVFKDYRTLDIQKFDIFRSVRKIGQRITEDHERPALACLIDDDLKITDADKYMLKLVNDKKHPEICEAVRKCFEYRTVLQITAPKVYEMESKNFHSGAFYTSFETVKDKLESFLLNFTLGGKDATGPEFAKYFLQSVHILNNP